LKRRFYSQKGARIPKKIGKESEKSIFLECKAVMTQTKSEFLLGELRLIPETRALVRDGQMRHLAKRPFQVLLYLIEHRDRLVTRRELLDSFWDGKDTYEETLTKCIGAIRKALADDSVHPRFIETRYSEGYRYIGDFEEIPAVDRSASKVETFKDA
jgi:DNA-binding winged helix-turn-helix (wHTH) protein